MRTGRCPYCHGPSAGCRSGISRRRAVDAGRAAVQRWILKVVVPVEAAGR